MKKLKNFATKTGIVLLVCAVLFSVGYSVYKLINEPAIPHVYATMKNGVYIKDSTLSTNETISFKNTTSRQKIVMGFHFKAMDPTDPPPYFTVVLEPSKDTVIAVPWQFIDQIRVCELDYSTASTKTLAHVNAHMLRKGMMND